MDTLSGGEAIDDEDLEEPEVPEYLLAERRQRGGGRPTGGRPARGRSAYQAALDRERFGSRGAPQPAFGGGAPRSAVAPHAPVALVAIAVVVAALSRAAAGQ